MCSGEPASQRDHATLLCSVLQAQQSDMAAGCSILPVRQRDSPDPTLVGDWWQTRTQTSKLAVPENCADSSVQSWATASDYEVCEHGTKQGTCGGGSCRTGPAGSCIGWRSPGEGVSACLDAKWSKMPSSVLWETAAVQLAQMLPLSQRFYQSLSAAGVTSSELHTVYTI